METTKISNDLLMIIINNGIGFVFSIVLLFILFKLVPVITEMKIVLVRISEILHDLKDKINKMC